MFAGLAWPILTALNRESLFLEGKSDFWKGGLFVRLLGWGLNIGLHYYIICAKYSFVHRYSGNAQIYGLKCFNYSLGIYWGPVYMI